MLPATTGFRWNRRPNIIAAIITQSASLGSCHICLTQQDKSEGFDSCKRPRNYTIKLCASFQIHRWIQTAAELQSRNTRIRVKIGYFSPVWPWNLMDDLEKQWGTFSMLRQTLCNISKPSMNSSLSYSLETLNSGQNQRFVVPCDLEI